MLPMRTKQYDIFLDDINIGTTKFEKADPPMGIVFGQMEFANNSLGYDFFKKYCLENNIELADDYPEDKIISTRTIKNLKVINEIGTEIRGIGNQICGMDGDIFEITIEGVAHPFFEEEFPHHIKGYYDQFKE